MGKEFDTETVRTEFRRGLPQEFLDWAIKTHGIKVPSLASTQRGAIPKWLLSKVCEKWTFEPPNHDTKLRIENLLAIELLLAEWKPGKNKDLLSEMQRQAVEFAIENYSRRGWNEDFADKLRAQAKENWDRSTYVVVRKHHATKPGEMLGTLRLTSTGADPRVRYVGRYSELPDPTQATGATWDLRLPNGMAHPRHSWFSRHLPVEEILGVTLPRPAMELKVSAEGDPEFDPELITHLAGETIEPGTFAVKRGTSSEVFQSIVRHLLMSTFENGNSAEYNEKGKVFYTYGDELGRRLYEPLGFQVVDDVPPIEKYGVKWWLLRATPNDARQFVEANGRRHAWTADEVEKIREAITRLSLNGVRNGVKAEAPGPLGEKETPGNNTWVIPIHPRK